MNKNKPADNIDCRIDWAAIDDEIIQIGYNYNIFTIVLISDKLDDMSRIKTKYNQCIEVPGGHRLVNKYARQIANHYDKIKACYSTCWECRDVCVIKLYIDMNALTCIKKLNKSVVDYDEYILSAAISLTLKEGNSPVILGGYRHADCFSTAVQLGYTGHINADEQGFLTSKGRFVDRREAKLIAKRAGQLKRTSALKSLLSEDLY